jgi:hypothetical protein
MTPGNNPEASIHKRILFNIIQRKMALRIPFPLCTKKKKINMKRISGFVSVKFFKIQEHGHNLTSPKH